MNPSNLLNNDERMMINKIVSFHKKKQVFPAACLVGSLAKGFFTETSDIDLIIFCDDSRFSIEGYSRYINDLKLEAKLKDDAYDFSIGKRNASLLYKSYPNFIKNIYNITNGEKVDIYYKNWSYGGVIDDVLLFDFSNAIILYDSPGKLSILSDYLKAQYPLRLKQAIIDSTAIIIDTKIKGIKRFEKNPIISSIAVNELFVAYIRRMYAIYEIYMPGLKHVFSECNLNFLKNNIPELYSSYELYIKSKNNNYEPLYSYIEKHLEVR